MATVNPDEEYCNECGTCALKGSCTCCLGTLQGAAHGKPPSVSPSPSQQQQQQQQQQSLSLICLVLATSSLLGLSCGPSTTPSSIELRADNGSQRSFVCESKTALKADDLAFLMPYYDEVAATNLDAVKAKKEARLRRLALIILRHKCGI